MSTITAIESGVPGLDEVLHGGWPGQRLHLVLGHPGAGKTTIGLQFLLEGAARGEPVLYVSLSETRAEVEQVAHSHGWTLEGVTLFELDAAEEASDSGARSMFDPAEVELRRTSRSILDEIERLRPRRVVFDSLAELELMAGSPLVFRRELMNLKRRLIQMKTTALLMSDSSAPRAEAEIQSLVHGVVSLESRAPEYGPERRRMRVRKLRGTRYRGGYHDFRIETGGVRVYPRLISDGAPQAEPGPPLRTGVTELDALLGDGLARGSSTLVIGPAGAGKSSVLAQLAHAALRQGEKATIYLFEEAEEVFLGRAAALGSDLRGALDEGRLRLWHVNPAELSPGEFSHRVREEVDEHGVGFVGVDSLNGYVYAMPEERFLTLHVHELLDYLRRRGVVTVLIMAQHGLVGQMTTPADVTYVADALVLVRFFEAQGRVRRGISMLKNRFGAHETAIRELQIGDAGLRVGAPLTDFHGVLSGIPSFVGEKAGLMGDAHDDA